MKKITILTLALITLMGCSTDDPLQTSLIITTTDADGQPLSGVSVELYMSLNEWLEESSQVFDTEESDMDGQVTYLTIDTGTYYINAHLDLSTNWEEGVVKRVIGGFQNSTDIVIAENSSAFLSKAEGKKWILDGYLKNSEDFWEFLEECVKDDTLIFYKGPGLGAHHISRGSLKCTEFQEDLVLGAWSLTNNDKQLIIDFGDEVLNWNIDTLKVDKLSVSYVQAGNVQNLTYVAIE